MDDIEVKPPRLPEDDLWMVKYTFRGRWERRLRRLHRVFRKKQAIAIGLLSGLLCGSCGGWLWLSF